MAVKVVRVRRKRRVRSFRGDDPFPHLRHQLTPARFGLLAAALAVAVVLGVVLFSYGSRTYTRWHETRLLKRAGALLHQRNFPEAITTAREVLSLHHDSLPAYQILAEATEKENLEETVVWRAQIARLLPHNVDSQLNLASAALRFGRLDLARQALKNVPPDRRDRASYHVVAGWLARAEGNVAEQERQFAAAVKKEPGNELYQFNLAALQVGSSDAAKSADARATLQHLAGKSVALRTGALRALLNDAVERNDLAAADEFAQELQLAPDITFSDSLLCLDFYRKLDKNRFDALLKKVKGLATRDPADIALLMGWLNENRLARDTLKWTDRLPSRVTDKAPVAVAVAEAFADIKNWSRLRRWTRNGSWDNADYLRLAYQAFGAQQSRQASADAEFESLWNAAERATYEQPERLVKLARLATKWKLGIEAEQLWDRLSHNPPTRREALDALYRIYRSNNDLRKLYSVLQRLHDASPNEAAITTKLARLGLHIDQNTKQAQRLAKEAYDRAPQDVNCAVTYAFSLYATGRTTEGLEILQKFPPEPLHDPHAAVYMAALLLDDNQTQAAREYIDAAQKGKLYVEERRLLEDSLTKLAGASPTPGPSASPAGSPAKPAPSPVPAASQRPGVVPDPGT
jgi:thioredoxin-like negative regulator of GroEL